MANVTIDDLRLAIWQAGYRYTIDEDNTGRWVFTTDPRPSAARNLPQDFSGMPTITSVERMVDREQATFAPQDVSGYFYRLNIQPDAAFRAKYPDADPGNPPSNPPLPPVTLDQLHTFIVEEALQFKDRPSDTLDRDSFVDAISPDGSVAFSFTSKTLAGQWEFAPESVLAVLVQNNLDPPADFKASYPTLMALQEPAQQAAAPADPAPAAPGPASDNSAPPAIATADDPASDQQRAQDEQQRLDEQRRQQEEQQREQQRQTEEQQRQQESDRARIR